MSNNQVEMFSLYDYLGHAAGKKLGEQVAAYAKLRKAKFGTKSVSNPAYQGHVMVYTKRFLDECFNAKKVFTPAQEDLTELNTLLANNNFKEGLPF